MPSPAGRRTPGFWYSISNLLLVLLLILVQALPAAAGDDGSAQQPPNVAVPAEPTSGSQLEPGAANDLLGRYARGFILETRDGRFSLQIQAGVQLRYTFVDYDPMVQGNQDDYSSFYMRRARLWLKGHAYDERLGYLIHLQLEPDSDVNAHDIWLTYRFSDLLKLGAGRNKIAYGLEFLSSGFGLSMVERSVMYGETEIEEGGGGSVYPGGGTARFGLHAEAETGFATGGLCLYRSQGVQLEGRRGGDAEPTFEYQAGLWQGRRTRGGSNRATDHLVAIRTGYYPFGWIDWGLQGDGMGSQHYKLGVLVSAYTQSSDKGGGFDERGYNLAVEQRLRGFSADLEWAREIFDYDLASEDLERRGWRAQLGYFVVPSKIELVGRYAAIERLVDPTAAKALGSGLGLVHLLSDGAPVLALEKQIDEISLGVSYYLNDWHQHKLQLDLTRLRRSFAADPAAGIAAADDQEDLRLRALVQLKL